MIQALFKLHVLYCPFGMCRASLLGVHAVWFDNYSKLFKMNRFTIQHGSFRSGLWSAEGIRKYAGAHPLSLDVVDSRTGILCALPDDPFVHVDDLVVALERRDSEGSFYRVNSLVDKYSISWVPVKIDPKIAEEIDGDKMNANILNEHRDVLKHFSPNRLIQLNPGSDHDLIMYVSSIKHVLISDMYQNRYLPIFMDCR